MAGTELVVNVGWTEAKEFGELVVDWAPAAIDNAVGSSSAVVAV
jgi:hypothetical protein